MLSRYIRSWEGYKLHIGSNLHQRTTSEKRTKALLPKCPLFGGSTVLMLMSSCIYVVLCLCMTMKSQPSKFLFSSIIHATNDNFNVLQSEWPRQHSGSIQSMTSAWFSSAMQCPEHESNQPSPTVQYHTVTQSSCILSGNLTDTQHNLLIHSRPHIDLCILPLGKLRKAGIFEWKLQIIHTNTLYKNTTNNSSTSYTW